MKTAVLILSASGLDMARRVRDAGMGETTIYGPACVVGRCAVAGGATNGVFPTHEPGVFGWVGPLRAVFPMVWEQHDAIVAAMALGIVVRLTGPLATDKRRDPAVVVVDDAGRFAVSVLGGHGAGANDLAVRVARILGALPVVTTASESRGVPAVDRVGREHGWRIERGENLTRVAATVVRGERVAVWQDAGATDWWRAFGGWPGHFTRVASWDDLDALDPAALLAVSDRVLPEDRLPRGRTILYRPPTLVAGIGCKRGTPRETIDSWVASVFEAHGLAAASLSTVATVMLKVDEPGLIAFAAGRDVPLVAFPAEQLEGQPGVERPSERVRARVGIPAVAEPAALRAASASTLVVPKQKGLGVTLAVARRG